MSPLNSQKSWLLSAKRELSKSIPGLTWDSFAKLVGADPRAFKTYRMPEVSADYRTMPGVTRSAIEKLLSEYRGAKSQVTDVSESPSLVSTNLLIPSLAALVICLSTGLLRGAKQP